jgi:RecB family exonuclease
MFDARPPLDRVASDRAPPIVANESVRGGANLIETQSECPFRAVSCYRLRAEVWPPMPAGLTALERGSLLHAALAAFWRELRTHAALCALGPSELDARIAAAVAEAMSSKLDVRRAQALPPLVRASEPGRLAALIHRWIEVGERGRQAFAVRAVEHAKEVALGGLKLAIRLDRVDELAGGGTAIIDYKSGEVPKLARTFERRPRATQLAVYALAWRAAERDCALRAVAFAQVSPDAVEPSGIAADASAWPGLTLADELPADAPHDWGGIVAWWNDAMSALARDYAAGEAAVDPREPDVCKRCGMQALCRIDAAPFAFEPNGDA